MPIFRKSIRQDVADAVGLSLDADNAATPEQAQRRRDPAFREKVLLAYEYRCCVCAHDLRMGSHAWVATSRGWKPRTSSGSRPLPGRPDVVPNGLALSLAAPQDLRPRCVRRAAGEPPDRVQPPPPP
jgi:putative restriction endonuclease